MICKPSLWKPPEKGVVLRRNDPRAWSGVTTKKADINAAAKLMPPGIVPVMFHDDSRVTWEGISNLIAYKDAMQEYKNKVRNLLERTAEWIIKNRSGI